MKKYVRAVYTADFEIDEASSQHLRECVVCGLARVMARIADGSASDAAHGSMMVDGVELKWSVCIQYPEGADRAPGAPLYRVVVEPVREARG